MAHAPNKTKVLFVITKSNFGGAQKYVLDLATTLPTEQFGISVAMGGNGLLKDKLEAEHIRTTTIPFLTRDIKIWGDIRSFFFLWKLFLKEQPDVVHLNSSKIGAMGALAARLAGIPKIIFTAHGWAWNENRSLFSQKIIKGISLGTVLLCHKTIAVSETTKRQMDWPMAQKKIVVIKNGILPIDFIEQGEAKKKLFELAGKEMSPEALLLGTIAELHQNKGLEYGLKAFKEIARTRPKLYWIIIGDGEERVKLEELIQEMRLSERVYLVGFVDQACRYLKAFDLFLLPSITEALALSILEAGLASLPTVATLVGGIPEIIDDMKQGLLVEPKNSEKLVDALEWMISNGGEAKALGEKLNKKIVQEFGFERELEQTISLYIKKRA